MENALRYPIHSSSPLRRAALAGLNSQDAGLVLHQESHCTETHLQQVAKLVDRVVLFDRDCAVYHSTHQTFDCGLTYPGMANWRTQK